eukprot:COSAG01_NODE_3400_length_6142_cov_8.459374_5_plen_101_part_00
MTASSTTILVHVALRTHGRRLRSDYETCLQVISIVVYRDRCDSKTTCALLDLVRFFTTSRLSKSYHMLPSALGSAIVAAMIPAAGEYFATSVSMMCLSIT